MFSAGIIHLLPDAAENLEDDSLWAFICCSSSFLLLFLLEKTLHQNDGYQKVNCNFFQVFLQRINDFLAQNIQAPPWYRPEMYPIVRRLQL